MKKWCRYLLMPVHAAMIASGAKSFRGNPVIGSASLNRRGLHLARRRLARRMGALRRSRLASLIPAQDRADFERDGFLLKRDFLDPASFQALRQEIYRLDAEAREAVIGDTLTRLIPLDATTLRHLPATRRMIESDVFRNALDYIGSFKRRPHLFIQTVFSRFRENAPPDVQSFLHSDTFHPTVKAWFYLEDVEANPLTYVPGSHVANRRRLAWERRVSITAANSPEPLTAEGSLRASEAEIRRMGYPAPVKLSVGANTLIVADTSGFHKREPSAAQATRVSIWAYSRSNPFLPWVGFDIGALPFIRSHAARLFWLGQDLVRWLFRTKSAWRWVGRRTPLAPPQE